MGEGLGLVQRPIGEIPIGIQHRYVAYHGHPTVRVRFEAERENGGQNEEYRDHGNDLKREMKNGQNVTSFDKPNVPKFILG